MRKYYKVEILQTDYAGDEGEIRYAEEVDAKMYIEDGLAKYTEPEAVTYPQNSANTIWISQQEDYPVFCRACHSEEPLVDCEEECYCKKCGYKYVKLCVIGGKGYCEWLPAGMAWKLGEIVIPEIPAKFKPTDISQIPKDKIIDAYNYEGHATGICPKCNEPVYHGLCNVTYFDDKIGKEVTVARPGGASGWRAPHHQDCWKEEYYINYLGEPTPEFLKKMQDIKDTIKKAFDVELQEYERYKEFMNSPEHKEELRKEEFRLKALVDMHERNKHRNVEFVHRNEVTPWASYKELIEYSFKGDYGPTDTKFDKLEVKIPVSDKLQGKLQLIHPTKERVVLARGFMKVEQDKKGYINVTRYVKCIDDAFDKRELQNMKDQVYEDYFVYRLIANDSSFVVLSTEKLKSDMYNLQGMIIPVTNNVEISKSFGLSSLSHVFISEHAVPAVKTLPAAELVEYVKKAGWDKAKFINVMFHHPNQPHFNIYPAYADFMGCCMLSGKKDGYPLHPLTVSGAGLGKTTTLECLDEKFNESIIAAANCTLKALIPSYKGSIPDPGFVLTKNRISIIDEFFKMVEAVAIIDPNRARNMFGCLNDILEHKARHFGSGNGSFPGQATCKVIFATNPLSGKNFITEHSSVMDITFMSRVLIWVIDKDHKKFIMDVKEDGGKA